MCTISYRASKVPQTLSHPSRTGLHSWQRRDNTTSRRIYVYRKADLLQLKGYRLRDMRSIEVGRGEHTNQHENSDPPKLSR